MTTIIAIFLCIGACLLAMIVGCWFCCPDRDFHDPYDNGLSDDRRDQ